jgi:hypothetical protein
MIPAIHYFSRLVRRTLHPRATLRAFMLPAMLAAGFLTAMSEAQVVNVPTPVATSSGFQGFINTTTYFATLIRDTSYVGNNPGPIVIYSWNPATHQTTITTVPPNAPYDTDVCQGIIAILSNTQMTASGTCCPTCTVDGDVDRFTLFDPLNNPAAATTTTTLTVTSGDSAVTSVASGAVVTLTATVVSGSAKVTPGQVNFCDAAAARCEDSALLASAQLTTAGSATYKFRPGPGSHKYQAVFVGTTSYANSSSAASALTVSSPAKYPTTTAIASSGSPGNYTLTATVVGIGSNTLSPTGDVSFVDTTNGNASLGTAALGTATGAGGTGFTTGPTSATGSAPTSVAVGDFNGDGIPDLVTANSAGNTMSVLLGNGDGTFTLKSSPAVGNAPYSFAIGDFNGDGILDMAVANCGNCSYFSYNSNTVTVLLGNGDGTFTTKSTLTVGTAPEFVAIGDFNGDGIPDLAVTNGSDNTITVLLGNGDGTFTTKSTLTVGAAPRFLVVSDFNGDGIPDLAVANSGDSTVTVLLGNGDGTFSFKSSPAAAPSNLVLVVGDFNGDGIPDLATANEGVVTVLLGNGDGTFTAKTSSATDYYYVGIVVGDFNGDGILDLALSSCGSHCGGVNQVPVLLGNGDGTFSTGPMLTPGYLPFSLAVADFNGDGTQDLASASFDDDTVTVLLNNISETATATLSNVSISGTETHLIEASYPGDTNFSASTSSTLPLLAAKVTTTLTLSSNSNPDSVAALPTFTATLSPYSLASITTDGETVTFYEGGTAVGTGTLSSGVATWYMQPLYRVPAGTYSITASYSGDANFSGSTSGTVLQTISPLPTTLTLTSSTNAPASNQITLTAILNPYGFGPLPTNLGETITFYNGGTIIGTGTLSELFAAPYTAGFATLNIASLPAGTDTLTAAYASDGYYAAATSNSVAQLVEPVAGTPIFSLPSGTYPNATITINDATPGATIYCTIDGGPPSSSSAVCTKPIFFNNVGIHTIQAIAIESGYIDSAVATAEYTIKPVLARPVFSPPAGSYTTPQSVTLSDVSRGTTFYYTTDGSMPTTSSTLYMGSITVSANETSNAIAVSNGATDSPVTSAAYTIEPLPAPTFSVASGTYPSTTVTLSATSGATIYCTIDGGRPSSSSAVCTKPIFFNNVGIHTIQAIAVESGYIDSAVAMAEYTIKPVLARPVFSPPAGSYTTPQSVTLSDVSRGTTFYYTIDGSMPTTSSAHYTGPITVSANETINAIAVSNGATDSPVTSAAYTIDPP